MSEREADYLEAREELAQARRQPYASQNIDAAYARYLAAVAALRETEGRAS